MGKTFKRISVFLLIVVLLAGGIVGYIFYKRIYSPNLHIEENEEPYFYIHTGWVRQDVLADLEERNWIKDPNSLAWLAEKKNYDGNNIVAGKYELKDAWSNDQLIDHLRAGNGVIDVKLTFNNVRTAEELAGILAADIEADSLSILQYFNDPAKAGQYGFTEDSFMSMFIPDTYFTPWNISAETLFDRIHREYKAYWNEERLAKAKSIGLSPVEVSILASMVQAEQSQHPDERARVAGLYLNRLQRGMLLQSDPTVVYAMGDFSINRVLTDHLKFQSPYNTYLNSGLPPGPINLPDKRSLDAVLNAEEHKYLYMCAKEDFSGYHSFAKTLREHNLNARRYQNALNKRKIYR